MLRGLVHLLAWSLATGAAATLSWWGVHTVMAGTAYDPPRALPIAAAEAPRQESAPAASPTSRPAVSKPPSAGPSASSGGPAVTPVPSRPARPASGPAPSPTASGRVRSYDTEGGRVVFDLGEVSANLVSATPGTDWSMQVWKTETWIRVEFTSGTDRVSVICAWHDGPPHVEIGNY
ncbi:hypothetical protein ACF09J_07150 [Streptomyces sp. NPDC014889]|uniref:hypothetical protein n=1 Tax=Streptomyces sp. NPDC014889 TaxID=3364928 RepID=UPI0036F6B88F